MTLKDIEELFAPKGYPWLKEVKDRDMNENNIYVFQDILIHRVYLVWHMIDKPGHWKVVSNKGDSLTLPEDIDRLK